MGFGNIKKSVEVALGDAVKSQEFKDSVNKVVSASVNEAAEVIEKIVETKTESEIAKRLDDGPECSTENKDKSWTKLSPKLVKDDKP